MRVIGRVLLGVLVLVVVVAIVVYADGAMLPVDHSTTVSGLIDGPPAKVYALITNVGDGASWRHSVKSVQVLPPDQGRDHWIEDLGHGETMNFLAVRTEPVSPAGVGRRDVLLSEPSASYGGTWTYEISPGGSAGQTRLSITETGFIKPPVYRFVMRHVMGMTANLDQYMADIKAAATKG